MCLSKLTVPFFLLCSLVLAAVPGASLADEACAPVPPVEVVPSDTGRVVIETEWKRAIDQDKAVDIRRLLPSVDVTVTNDKGKTALMAAVKVGDLCLMQELMHRGLKISDRGYTGGTTLMYAVLGNQLAMIDRVLSYKPDLNEQSTNGWTAAMIAAAKGFKVAIKVLHEAGADVNQADVYQWTPLMRAMENRHESVVNYLLSLPDIDITHINENGSTALHIAAQSDDRSTAEKLLQLGAAKNTQDKNGYTPAEIAASNDHSVLAEHIELYVK